MKIFLMGRAGYIGLHMVKVAHKSGLEVITLDNLSTGYQDSVLHDLNQAKKEELCKINGY